MKITMLLLINIIGLAAHALEKLPVNMGEFYFSRACKVIGNSTAKESEISCVGSTSRRYNTAVSLAVQESFLEHDDLITNLDAIPSERILENPSAALAIALDRSSDKITYVSSFVNGIIKKLSKKGICAYWDGRELLVKDSNKRAEFYNVISSKGHPRRFSNVARCTPAPQFEKPKSPRTFDPTCGIPKSASFYCEQRSGHGKYTAQVSQAIDNVIQSHPGIFNLNDRNPGLLESYKVLNEDAYKFFVVQQLRHLGLCAVDEGEEIAIKGVDDKNSFSEHYDIYLSAGYILRRNKPSATCFPAGF